MPTMIGAMIAGENISALEVSTSLSLLFSNSASRKDRTRSSTDATTKMTTVFCNDFQKTLSRKSLM